MRFTPSGQAVANFTIATHESWNDKSGQKQDKTEWHRIVVWGKQAEHCGEYLKKGRQVYVEGKLQTREWTDKEGRKNYTTEVVAFNVTFLSDGSGGRRQSGGQDDSGPPPPGFDEPSHGGGSSGGRSGGASGGGAPSEDDIPF